MRQNRAWRFDFLDSETSPGRGGILVSPLSNGVEMVEGSDSIRQAILMLLFTEPGERIMRPDYGCPLRHLMFSPNDDTTAGLVIHYVKKAINRWEPRIDELEVTARRHEEEPGALIIQIQYREKMNGQKDAMEVPIQLMGEDD